MQTSDTYLVIHQYQCCILQSTYILPLQVGNLILKPVVELLEDQSPSLASSYLWSNKQGDQCEIALLDQTLNKKAQNFPPCLYRQKYPHLQPPFLKKKSISLHWLGVFCKKDTFSLLKVFLDEVGQILENNF